MCRIEFVKNGGYSNRITHNSLFTAHISDIIHPTSDIVLCPMVQLANISHFDCDVPGSNPGWATDARAGAPTGARFFKRSLKLTRIY